MKKQFTTICRTKAEYNSNGTAVAVPPQSFSTLAAAKSFMRTKLSAAAATYAEVYDVSGCCFRGRNPGGA